MPGAFPGRISQRGTSRSSARSKSRSRSTTRSCARCRSFDTSFKGVHWRELAKLVQPKQSAHFALAHAEQGFTANVPLEALEDDNALVAWEADGEPLEPEHGWPLRLVVPSRYFWKSAKWLRGIELLPADQPGFWERYGYHNDADYWKEERYEF